MARHHYSTTLTFPAGGTDHEIDVTVSFAVSPGCPASFSGPAEDAEVSDITLVEVGGKPRPWRFHNWSDGHFAELVAERLFASETHLERMLEIASEGWDDIEAEISERRWADRCEEYAA